MCGRTARDRRAQLALMDAMVFFAVSTVICAVMVSYVAPVTEESEGPGPPDLAHLLASFVDSSIGQNIVVEEYGLELTCRERVGDTILLMASLVLEGCPEDSFRDVIQHLDSVLDALCGPWLHELRVLSLSADGWTVLLRGGDWMQGTPDTSSVAQNLGECGGIPLLLALVLLPPLLLHDF